MSPLTRSPGSRSSARPRRLAMAAALCAALTSGAALDTGKPAGAAQLAAPGPQSSGQSAEPADKPSAIHSAAAAARVMDDVPEKGRPAAGPGTNILLVGLDRRTGIPKETRDRLHVNGEECNCTDVIMLLHISENGKRVSTVSIPRDSYVTFAAHREPGGTGAPRRHLGKINGAYAHGGPALTVRTVEAATGVRVDHYAETGFTGFADAVDSTGNTRVCTDKPLRDEGSGLDLEAGSHELDGAKALRYVRARHVSPPGDLGRVRRQQRLVEEMLTRLAGERVAGDETTLLRVATALRATVRMDDALSVPRLMRLGRDLRGLKPQQTEFATVPISDFDFRAPEWGSTLKWDRSRAEALFGNLREDRPLTGDPRTRPPGDLPPVGTPPEEVSVRVEGTGDRGDGVRRDLRDNGFDVRSSGAAGTGAVPARGRAAGDEERTFITYGPQREPEALALATALPDAELRPVKGHSGPPVVHLGAGGTEVVRVVYDRSSVEGVPVTGDELDCGGGPEAAG